MSDPRSMGDLFRERRAAAAASKTTSENNNSSNINSRQGGLMATHTQSFAEIQREQQQQQRHQQKQHQRSQQQREQHPADEFGRLVRPTGSSHGNPRSMNSGSSHQYGNNANTNRRGTSNNNTRGSRQIHRATLPKEEGVIHTLLDKFGFILCAERDQELFFHYSEFKQGHSNELNIGDEVEFRVGRAEERGGRRVAAGADSEKLSAFDVRKLPAGTIYWEKEDEPVGKRWRGFVDQPAREDHHQRQRVAMRDRNGGGTGAADGVIRIIEDVDGGGGNGEQLEIHYKPSDYAPAKPGQNPFRLERKDVVELTLVTERRTGKKYARNIELIKSERDRQREEREAKLLKGASLEMGKVVSTKGDFGFLRSTARLEEVYFHSSHVVLPEGCDETWRGVLKEGQDAEFYVIDESGGVTPPSADRRGNKKGGKGLSARKIKVLPPGTVKFEHTIAEGVTGIVTECPVASGMEPFGRRDDRRNTDRGINSVVHPKVGRIRLEEEIVFDNSDGEREVITHVSLPPDVYPGGTFVISRTGSEVGSWIRPGDVLLFNVVKKVIDGTCSAAPTKFLKRALLRPNGGATLPDDDDPSPFAKLSVRLIDPSLCGRAEGVIRSIHDNYGFIHLADRSADAYFPLFEVFPADIQGDLVRNNPDANHAKDLIQNKGGRTFVEVGMEVSFDLSAQVLSASGGGRTGDRGRYGKQVRSSPAAAQEKENLRARRIQILPRGTVKEKIVIAEEVKATVVREDPKQSFVGTLELKESLKIESGNQRYPLVAKLLDAITKGKYGTEGVVFHDVLSERDAQVVISLVNLRNGDLEWSYVSEHENGGGDGHNRKLCIVRKKRDSANKGDTEQRVTSTTSFESASKEANDVKEETLLREKDGDEAENNEVAASAEETANAGTGAEMKQDFKKKIKKTKIIKSLRFDKASFPDISISPLGIGDVVACDIFQSRRSGAAIVENIHVVERRDRPSPVVSDGEDGKDIVVATQRRSLSGFVTEVVASRQFGFITAVGEQGSKTGEHIFFHFKEIESPAVGGGGVDPAQDGSTPSSVARIRKSGKSDVAVIRKGDEVKFDVGPGKNGKLTAMNVSILPRGTLKIASNKAEHKSPSCTGYILMEPSHTSLANTPSHTVLHSGTTAVSGGGSRWDNVRDDKSTASKSGPNAKEGGVILLLSDPSHQFFMKPKMASPRKADAPIDEVPSGSENRGGTDISSAAESNKIGIKTENNDTDEAGKSPSTDVGIHLSYKPSSIVATRGFSAGVNNRRNLEPKRGDLVSFSKTRGSKLVKDIRIEKTGAATSVRGFLTEIKKEEDTAIFVSSDDNDSKYGIKLTEVISCEKTLLKDKEIVDGILHEGKIFGVCRTKDIYLASSFGRNSGGSNSSGGLKERPKLNLTVKKELQGMGGQIMAQSRMAKGPDGTNGFAPGWTKRVSPHAASKEEEQSTSLSAAASEFIPNFPVTATSGFELTEN